MIVIERQSYPPEGGRRGDNVRRDNNRERRDAGEADGQESRRWRKARHEKKEIKLFF